LRTFHSESILTLTRRICQLKHSLRSNKEGLGTDTESESKHTVTATAFPTEPNRFNPFLLKVEVMEGRLRLTVGPVPVMFSEALTGCEATALSAATPRQYIRAEGADPRKRRALLFAPRRCPAAAPPHRPPPGFCSTNISFGSHQGVCLRYDIRQSKLSSLLDINIFTDRTNIQSSAVPPQTDGSSIMK